MNNGTIVENIAIELIGWQCKRQAMKERNSPICDCTETENCKGYFRMCQRGHKCIPVCYFCDGENDCDDACDEDEKFCREQLVLYVMSQCTNNKNQLPSFHTVCTFTNRRSCKMRAQIGSLYSICTTQ